MLWLLSGPQGFTCLISFAPTYPYLCFISFLYLDLYVLGDGALISRGSFVQTKHLCVLLIVRLARRETGLSPPVKYFTDRSKEVLLLWIIYVISVLFLLCFRARRFIDILWSPAGKWLTFWLSFVMSNCEVVTFPLVS